MERRRTDSWKRFPPFPGSRGSRICSWILSPKGTHAHSVGSNDAYSSRGIGRTRYIDSSCFSLNSSFPLDRVNTLVRSNATAPLPHLILFSRFVSSLRGSLSYLQLGRFRNRRHETTTLPSRSNHDNDIHGLASTPTYYTKKRRKEIEKTSPDLKLHLSNRRMYITFSIC